MDKKKTVKSILTILLLNCLIFGCSVKEFRSPIVFRSPVVLKVPEDQTSSKTTAPTFPSETSKRPKHQINPPQISGPSPANILVLSDEDLNNYKFTMLGNISASSVTSKGFTKKNAIQELKVEAFKRYGSLAQGLIHIQYEKGYIFSAGENYKGVSGDVIMLDQETESKELKKPGTVAAFQKLEGNGLNIKDIRETYPLDNILILTAEDLFHLNFKTLGKVSVRLHRTQKGFTREEAVKALKIEAFRLFGKQAKGLMNLCLVKKQKIFYYTKVRKSISTPNEQCTYTSGSAEVVVWFE